MLIVVANAEGLATEEPLLAVVVAFSWAITDPVALESAASERLGIRSNTLQPESFMVQDATSGEGVGRMTVN